MKNNGEYLSPSVLPYANFKQDICETTKAFANLNYTIVDFHVLIFETNFLQIGTKIGRFLENPRSPADTCIVTHVVTKPPCCQLME